MGEAGIVFYDGCCGLCHRAVKSLVKRDRAGALRYAPFQGETFRARVDEATRATLPDSMIWLGVDGTLATRSDAMLASLRALGGGDRLLAWALSLVPRAIRDAAYAGIARIRKRLFAPPEGTCPRLPPDLAKRFLP